jgi:hypothetical protein
VSARLKYGPLFGFYARIWVRRIFAGKCSSGFSTTSFANRPAVVDECWFLYKRRLIRRGPGGLILLHDLDRLMGSSGAQNCSNLAADLYLRGYIFTCLNISSVSFKSANCPWRSLSQPGTFSERPWLVDSTVLAYSTVHTARMLLK